VVPAGSEEKMRSWEEKIVEQRLRTSRVLKRALACKAYSTFITKPGLQKRQKPATPTPNVASATKLNILRFLDRSILA
jgi:hypothetical protein